MTEPRRQRSVSLIKLMFVIVSLTLRINTVRSLDFGDKLDMYKESFQKMLEQAVGYQKQRQNRIENISSLLKEAQAITDEEQLDTFMENLQEAVNEAHEQKIEDKYRIRGAVQQMDLKLLELYPKIQNVKMMSNGDDQMLRVIEQLFGTVRTYLILKTKVVDPEPNEMAESLKDVVNALKRFQQQPHEEL